MKNHFNWACIQFLLLILLSIFTSTAHSGVTRDVGTCSITESSVNGAQMVNMTGYTTFVDGMVSVDGSDLVLAKAASSKQKRFQIDLLPASSNVNYPVNVNVSFLAKIDHGSIVDSDLIFHFTDHDKVSGVTIADNLVYFGYLANWNEGGANLSSGAGSTNTGSSDVGYLTTNYRRFHINTTIDADGTNRQQVTVSEIDGTEVYSSIAVTSRATLDPSKGLWFATTTDNGNDVAGLRLNGLSYTVTTNDCDESNDLFPTIDTDNDGIMDVSDLDDDNDGILDTVEGLTSTAITTASSNPAWSLSDGFTIGWRDNDGGFGLDELDGTESIHFGTHVTSVSGTAYVTLGTLAAGRYTLLADLGNFNNCDFPAAESGFRINGTDANAPGDLIPEQVDHKPTPNRSNDSYDVNPDNWKTWTYNLNIAPGDSRIGQSLGYSMSTAYDSTASCTNMSFDNVRLTFSPNSDTDENPNHLDIDSDGDGIPDNIEAQTTSGYIAPGTFNDSDNDGVNDVYAGGLTPTNTDSADNPDYLDLNSDNAQGTDSEEAYLTVSSTTDSDADGLIDAIDEDDNSFGPVNANVTTTLNSYPGVGVETWWRTSITNAPMTASNVDTDGDGVLDTVDLDDDNDGIPDLVESPPLVQQTLLNDSYLSASGASYVVYQFPTSSGFYTVDARSHVNCYNNYAKHIFHVDLDKQEIYSVSYQHYGASSPNSAVSGDGTNEIISSSNRFGKDAWRINGQDLEFVRYSNACSNGNRAIHVAISETGLSDDRIPNSLDLDSDGDGIPDNIEAQTTAGYITPASFTDANGDGINDIYGDGLTPINTDGADQPDYLDTNADNAQGSDSEEAYLDVSDKTDADNDGLVDAVDANNSNFGPVNAAINTTLSDYPNSADEVLWRTTKVNAPLTPSTTDTDGDGVVDSVDLDDDNDGIPDNVESPPLVEQTLVNDYGLSNPNESYVAFTFPQSSGFYTVKARSFVACYSSYNQHVFHVDLDKQEIYSASYQHFQSGADNDGVTGNGSNEISSASSNFGKTAWRINGSNLEFIFYSTACPNTGHRAISIAISETGLGDDRIPNALDLDSDGDGIPDNIEAQTTTGYIAPTSFTDANGDGINDIYGHGLTPINTDGTDQPDYLDTDSDNAQTTDAEEAHHDVSNSTDTDQDGLIDAVDLNDTGFGPVHRNVSNTLSAYPAHGQEVLWRNTAVYTEAQTLNLGLDTDGDGIPNSQDLDDDNDGILDTLEQTYTAIETDNTNTDITLSSGFSAGWMGGTVAGLNAIEGTQLVHLSNNTGSSVGRIYFPLGNAQAGQYHLQLDVGRFSGYQFLQGHISGLYLEGTDADNPGTLLTDQALLTPEPAEGQWATWQYTLTIPEGDTRIGKALAFAFESTELFTGHNGAIDNLRVTYAPDTDKDGIINAQDLDSDGDGIPDNIEAQATISYIAPGTFTDTNNDGVNDLYAGGLTPINTDGLDEPDYLDLDADNAQNSDASEAGIRTTDTTDADGDGLIAVVDQDDMTWGPVNAGINIPRDHYPFNAKQNEAFWRTATLQVTSQAQACFVHQEALTGADIPGLNTYNGTTNGFSGPYTHGTELIIPRTTSTYYKKRFEVNLLPANSNPGYPINLSIHFSARGVDVLDADPLGWVTDHNKASMFSFTDHATHLAESYDWNEGDEAVSNRNWSGAYVTTDLDARLKTTFNHYHLQMTVHEDGSNFMQMTITDQEGNETFKTPLEESNALLNADDGLWLAFGSWADSDDYDYALGHLKYTTESGICAATSASSALVDTDGDGIYNIDDLDSDNDGILDSIEQVTTPIPTVASNSAWSLTSGFSMGWRDNDGMYGLDEPDGDASLHFNTGAESHAGTAYVNLGTLQSGQYTVLVDIADFNGCPFPGAYLTHGIRVNGTDVNNLGDLAADQSMETPTPSPSDVATPSENWKTWRYTLNIQANDSRIGQTFGYSMGVAYTGDICRNMSMDNVRLTYSADSDQDNLPSYLDLDSDGDGIPDNIEAQATASYIAPGTFTDSNSDGVNDIYAAGLTPVNTDGADQPDYLDTDSDNAQGSDSQEANINVSDSTDTDQDGLFDGVDNDNSNWGHVNAGINDPLNHYPKQNNELLWRNTAQNSYLATESTLDTDGDGIYNDVDLDDDNDGILDATEQVVTNVVTASSNSAWSLSDGFTLGWWDAQGSHGLDEPDGTESIHFSTSDAASAGTAYVDLGTIQQGQYAVLVDVANFNNCGFPSNQITHGIRSNGANANNPGDLATDQSRYTPIPQLSSTSNTSENWEIWRYTLNIPANDPRIGQALGYSMGINTMDGECRNMSFDNVRLMYSPDTDGDGLSNHLDLDSDGDGIPDNIEAQATASYTVPGTFTDSNSDGVNDVYAAGLTPVNTDGTDQPDYLDTDSDNAQGSDAIEANLNLSDKTDTDGDGLIDRVDTNNAGWGAINAGINEPINHYPKQGDELLWRNSEDVSSAAIESALDTDGDGIYNDVDLDDDNDGILDATEQTQTAIVTAPSNSAWSLSDGFTSGWWDANGSYGLDEPDGTESIHLNTNAAGSAGTAYVDLGIIQQGQYAVLVDVANFNNCGFPNNQITHGIRSNGANANNPGDLATDQSRYTPTPQRSSTSNTSENWEIWRYTLNIPANDPRIGQALGYSMGIHTMDGECRNMTMDNLRLIYSPDHDNDGIMDHLDLDSDGDGIPDNIEAQTTAGYIAPGTFTDSNSDGVNDVYAAGLTPVNTDGTDEPDYLDTDSDNAQGKDKQEASLLVYGAIDDDQDGIIGGIDDNDATFGQVNIGISSPYAHYPNDGNNEVLWRTSSTASGSNTSSLDTDGDGVVDAKDIDDDNDSIPDTTEMVCLASPVILDLSDLNNIPDINYQGQTISITTDKKVNVIGSSNGHLDFQANAAYTSRAELELSFSQPVRSIFRSKRSSNGGWFNNLKDWLVTTQSDLHIHDPNDVLYSREETAETSIEFRSRSSANIVDLDWYVHGEPSQSFSIKLATQQANVAARIQIALCPPIDNDNDGIEDAHDLDSDGDGIPDSIEAQATNDYIAANPFKDTNGDGMHDAYGNGVTPVNTDGTDEPDYLDLDSDNAQGDDTTEAGLTLSNTTDSDGDGFVDSIDTDVNNWGPVSLGINSALAGKGNVISAYPNTSNENEVDWRYASVDIYTLSGRVYRDLNLDQTYTAGEPGITSLPMVLYDVDNAVCRSVRTGADGRFNFDKVTPGTYQVYEASREAVPVPNVCDPTQAKDPSGYESTTSNVYPSASTAITVTNQDITGIDFGDIPANAIAVKHGMTFLPDNNSVVAAGNNTLYWHQLTAPADGSVSFNINAITEGEDTYPANTDSGTKVTQAVPVPLGATAIRIYPKSIYGYISMRAALRVNEPGVGNVIYNPDDTLRSFSTIFDNNAKGTGHARSMLDSAQGWSVAIGSSLGTSWMEIPVSPTSQVTHVITQGRHNNGQWVTSYQVYYLLNGEWILASPPKRWDNRLLRDPNCDGKLESADWAPISGSIDVTANQTVCIAHRVAVPLDAVNDSVQTATITATFNFGNGSTGLDSIKRSVQDLTTVYAPVATPPDPSEPAPTTPAPSTPVAGQLVLHQTVANITAGTPASGMLNSADPEDVLEYRIEYRNEGNGPITDLKINDDVPEFTELVGGSIQCANTPAAMTCTPVNSDPYLEWGFTGNLEPGQSGYVHYRVQVE